MKTTNPLTDADISLIRFLHDYVDREEFTVSYDIYNKTVDISHYTGDFAPIDFIRIGVTEGTTRIYTISHYRQTDPFKTALIETERDVSNFTNAKKWLKLLKEGLIHHTTGKFITPELLATQST